MDAGPRTGSDSRLSPAEVPFDLCLRPVPGPTREWLDIEHPLAGTSQGHAIRRKVFAADHRDTFGEAVREWASDDVVGGVQPTPPSPCIRVSSTVIATRLQMIPGIGSRSHIVCVSACLGRAQAADASMQRRVLPCLDRESRVYALRIGVSVTANEDLIPSTNDRRGRAAPLGPAADAATAHKRPLR